MSAEDTSKLKVHVDLLAELLAATEPDPLTIAHEWQCIASLWTECIRYSPPTIDCFTLDGWDKIPDPTLETEGDFEEGLRQSGFIRLFEYGETFAWSAVVYQQHRETQEDLYLISFDTADTRSLIATESLPALLEFFRRYGAFFQGGIVQSMYENWQEIRQLLLNPHYGVLQEQVSYRNQAETIRLMKECSISKQPGNNSKSDDAAPQSNDPVGDIPV